ncbi:hypothetical protein GCM10028821_36420 [Hymenobacter jeollabukensis]
MASVLTVVGGGWLSVVGVVHARHGVALVGGIGGRRTGGLRGRVMLVLGSGSQGQQ